MSDDGRELKRKLEQMLASSDAEWVNAVTATVDAMYRQFEAERECEKTIVSFAPSAAPRRQIGFLHKIRSHDRFGENVVELSILLFII